MPSIQIQLSDDEYHQLYEEYRKMAIAWPRPGLAALPPSFEEWAAARMLSGSAAALEEEALADMRVFDALEKLVTALQPHGLALTRAERRSAPPAELADGLARDLRLAPQQSRRLADLLGYYLKDAKEVADHAHVGITSRAYGALNEACRELIERTDKALPRLGEERAIGRVEGAVAILVSVNAMERDAAKDRTEAFKLRARAFEK